MTVQTELGFGTLNKLREIIQNSSNIGRAIDLTSSSFSPAHGIKFLYFGQN